jgi:hypothetical protein
MWPAFPTSDYYRPSAPPRRHQPTADLSANARNGRNGQHRGGSHVHHVSIDGVGAQLFPLQHRHEYAADLLRGLATDCIRSASESLPAIMSGVRCAPAHIHQVGAGVALTELYSLVQTAFTPSRLACRTRVVWRCRPVPALSGLLPPSPASPGSGCPQLQRPAATGQGGVLSPPPGTRRLVAHPNDTTERRTRRSRRERGTACPYLSTGVPCRGRTIVVVAVRVDKLSYQWAI